MFRPSRSSAVFRTWSRCNVPSVWIAIVLRQIIRIFEKEAPGPRARRVDAGDKREHEHDLGEEDEDAAVAMMRGAARAHLDIEQMLLLALARIGDAPVAGRAADSVSLSFSCAGRARSESSMIRAQSCGK